MGHAMTRSAAVAIRPRAVRGGTGSTTSAASLPATGRAQDLRLRVGRFPQIHDETTSTYPRAEGVLTLCVAGASAPEAVDAEGRASCLTASPGNFLCVGGSRHLRASGRDLEYARKDTGVSEPVWFYPLPLEKGASA